MIIGRRSKVPLASLESNIVMKRFRDALCTFVWVSATLAIPSEAEEATTREGPTLDETINYINEKLSSKCAYPHKVKYLNGILYVDSPVMHTLLADNNDDGDYFHIWGGSDGDAGISIRMYDGDFIAAPSIPKESRVKLSALSTNVREGNVDTKYEVVVGKSGRVSNDNNDTFALGRWPSNAVPVIWLECISGACVEHREIERVPFEDVFPEVMADKLNDEYVQRRSSGYWLYPIESTSAFQFVVCDDDAVGRLTKAFTHLIRLSGGKDEEDELF